MRTTRLRARLKKEKMHHGDSSFIGIMEGYLAAGNQGSMYLKLDHK
jgi:hypothetical protein